MDFSFTLEEERFRTEVRAFIRDHMPKGASGDGDLEAGLASLPALYKWNQDLLAKGWVAFNWPKEVGGGGGSLVEQMILKEEMARHKAPALGLSAGALRGLSERSRDARARCGGGRCARRRGGDRRGSTGASHRAYGPALPTCVPASHSHRLRRVVTRSLRVDVGDAGTASVFR